MSAEKRLEELGIELPAAATPIGNYVTTVQTGNLIFTSGHGPGRGEGPLYKGQVGTDLTIEEGYASARQVGLGPPRHAQKCARRSGSRQARRESGRVRQFRPELHGAALRGQRRIGPVGGGVRR